MKFSSCWCTASNSRSGGNHKGINPVKVGEKGLHISIQILQFSPRLLWERAFPWKTCSLVLLSHFHWKTSPTFPYRKPEESSTILYTYFQNGKESPTLFLVSQHLCGFKTRTVIPSFSPSIYHFAIRRQFPRMLRQFPSKLHSNCTGKRVARLSVVNFQTTTADRIDGEGLEGYWRSYYRRRAIFGISRSKCKQKWQLWRGGPNVNVVGCRVLQYLLVKEFSALKVTSIMYRNKDIQKVRLQQNWENCFQHIIKLDE